MEAGTRGVAGVRLPAVSQATHRRLAVLALVALFLIVVSGATVRLTGSGLGCENWPRCGDTVLPAKDVNAYVEFGNRVVGFLVGLTTLAAAFAAWRARVERRLFLRTLALPFLVLAQGILGGVTVLFELHPLIVMGHFLLSLLALAIAVTVVLGAYARAPSSRQRGARPWLGRLALALVPLALLLVVTGALVTAAGPHSGGEDIQRFGDLEATIDVHVAVTAVFGVAYLVLLAALLRAGAPARTPARVALATFALLVLQMAIGEVQWRNQLPWALVLAHVTVATAVWTGVVALAMLVRTSGNARPVP